MEAVKRFLPIEGEALLSEYEVVIELKPQAVQSLALELALLLMGLAASLRIQPDKGPRLLLTLIEGKKPRSEAVVTRESDESLFFGLGRNQAEYLQVKLLRAYRDQMAEVNHVHVEGMNDGRQFDLTVMFEVYREPMSPEKIMEDMEKRPERYN